MDNNSEITCKDHQGERITYALTEGCYNNNLLCQRCLLQNPFNQCIQDYLISIDQIISKQSHQPLKNWPPKIGKEIIEKLNSFSGMNQHEEDRDQLKQFYEELKKQVLISIEDSLQKQLNTLDQQYQRDIEMMHFYNDAFHLNELRNIFAKNHDNIENDYREFLRRNEKLWEHNINILQKQIQYDSASYYCIQKEQAQLIRIVINSLISKINFISTEQEQLYYSKNEYRINSIQEISDTVKQTITQYKESNYKQKQPEELQERNLLDSSFLNYFPIKKKLESAKQRLYSSLENSIDETEIQQQKHQEYDLDILKIYKIPSSNSDKGQYSPPKEDTIATVDLDRNSPVKNDRINNKNGKRDIIQREEFEKSVVNKKVRNSYNTFNQFRLVEHQQLNESINQNQASRNKYKQMHNKTDEQSIGIRNSIQINQNRFQSQPSFLNHQNTTKQLSQVNIILNHNNDTCIHFEESKPFLVCSYNQLDPNKSYIIRLSFSKAFNNFKKLNIGVVDDSQKKLSQNSSTMLCSSEVNESQNLNSILEIRICLNKQKLLFAFASNYSLVYDKSQQLSPLYKDKGSYRFAIENDNNHKQSQQQQYNSNSYLFEQEQAPIQQQILQQFQSQQLSSERDYIEVIHFQQSDDFIGF